MAIEKRSGDLEKLIKKLDLNETMKKNADEKYTAVSKYLDENGIEADIYPQGSFALGTVVRPYKEDEDASYDLDFICELREKSKKNTTPCDVKNEVGDILKKGYDGKLKKEDDTCWTLEYAEIQENVGFNIDIVPAVSEEEMKKHQLIARGVQAGYANGALAITNRINQVAYTWGDSNARGYTAWFNDINKPYMEYKEAERRRLEEERKRRIENSFEARIEEIPDTTDKSNLQRVIQILKRHRDVHYSRANTEKKVSSSILTTAVAQIAKTTHSNRDLLDLLSFVTNELYTYSKLQSQEERIFLFDNADKLTIRKENDKWIIPNPVNPDNNLASDWTNETARYFFKWIEEAKRDLVDSIEYDDERYRVALISSFGDKAITRFSDEIGLPQQKVKPIEIINSTKPWRNNDN